MSSNNDEKNLIGASESIPSKSYSIDDQAASKDYVANIISSTILPHKDHITFVQIPKRTVINAIKKLERIKISAKDFTWRDAFLGISTAFLGGIIGGILSGVKPVFFWPIIYYFVSLIMFLVFGLLYIMVGKSTKPSIYDDASDVLEELDLLISRTAGENHEP